MSCITKGNQNSFLRFFKVDQSDGVVTAQDLQNSFPAFCGALEILGNSISFSTTWDDDSAEDGEFVVSVTSTELGNSDFVWLLPNGDLVSGKTLVIAADSGILDGTEKEIVLTSNNFDLLDTIDWSAKKLTGEISWDQSLTGWSTINLSNNSIVTSDINRILFDIDGFTGSGVRTLNLAGNCAYNSSTGGINGVTAANSLTAKFTNISSAGSVTDFRMNCAAYDNKSFDASAQLGSNILAVWINSDSTIFYIANLTTIYQYTLSTAKVIDTAVYSTKNFTPGGGAILSMQINPSGSRVNVIKSGGIGSEYPLSITDDISSAGAENSNHDFSPEDSAPQSIKFGDSGNKCFMIDRSATVYQYSGMTTPYTFDGSFAYDTVSHDFTDVLSNARGMTFNDDGTRIYILDDSRDIYEYELSAPWVITSPTFIIKKSLIPDLVTVAGEFVFTSDGTNFYVAGQSGPAPVTQWSTAQ